MKHLNLTNEELCRLAKNGDGDALENLIENNIKFVESIAKMYSQYRMIDIDDLLQAGRIAIWKCADKFDERFGVTFLSYAKRAIQNEMMSLIRKNLSISASEELGFEENIETGESPTSSEAGDEHYSETPENIFFKTDQTRELYAALKQLEPRQRTYLIYRFGECGHSAADTAFHFSMSENRAKTIEMAAIDKLRSMLLFPTGYIPFVTTRHCCFSAKATNQQYRLTRTKTACTKDGSADCFRAAYDLNRLSQTFLNPFKPPAVTKGITH